MDCAEDVRKLQGHHVELIWWRRVHIKNRWVTTITAAPHGAAKTDRLGAHASTPQPRPHQPPPAFFWEMETCASQCFGHRGSCKQCVSLGRGMNHSTDDSEVPRFPSYCCFKAVSSMAPFQTLPSGLKGTRCLCVCGRGYLVFLLLIFFFFGGGDFFLLHV